MYNDKELEDDGDLDWYDYGFRNYDPQIGRFTQLDPLTDEYPQLTPYQYASDEPVANMDRDGLEADNQLAPVTVTTIIPHSQALINTANMIANVAGTVRSFQVTRYVYNYENSKGEIFCTKEQHGDVIHYNSQDWNFIGTSEDKYMVSDWRVGLSPAELKARYSFYSMAVGQLFAEGKYYGKFKDNLAWSLAARNWNASHTTGYPWQERWTYNAFYSGGTEYAGDGKSEALGNTEWGSVIVSGAVDIVANIAARSTAATAEGVLDEAVVNKGMSGNGRVFWSGGEDVMNQATQHAQEFGKTTLGMTRAGQNLQDLITTRNIPWEEARPMWARLSSTYARGAVGSVDFFGPEYEGSIWMEFEKPILLQNNVQIIYH